MTYSDEDIVRQLRLGEDSRWEFKQVAFTGNRPTRPSRDDWADEIAAFANARGGVFLCGVTDGGEVQGNISREQIVALDAVLVEVSSDAIKPPVRIHTSHRMLPEGGRVLLLEVPESDAQHDSPGGSYVRVGASKRRMTNDCGWRNGGGKRGSAGSTSNPSRRRGSARWTSRSGVLS